MVAGGGLEPSDLRVMSPTSYQLLYPAVMDCKDTQFSEFPNFSSKRLFEEGDGFGDWEGCLLSALEVLDIDGTRLSL